MSKYNSVEIQVLRKIESWLYLVVLLKCVEINVCHSDHWSPQLVIWSIRSINHSRRTYYNLLYVKFHAHGAYRATNKISFVRDIIKIDIYLWYTTKTKRQINSVTVINSLKYYAKKYYSKNTFLELSLPPPSRWFLLL